MLDRLFLAHPRAVDETYLEHQRMAFAFAGDLLLAALACALHGLVPALCPKTASNQVRRLYERMVAHRRKPAVDPAPQTEPWADYAI